MQFIFVVGLFFVAFTLFAVSLKFSRYKERPEGCCGGGHCSAEGKAAAGCCREE